MQASTELVYAGAVVPLVVALGIAIIVWHSAGVHRRSQVLHEGLFNEDPTVRRRTLEVLDESSLAANASVLHGLLQHEHDPDVLDALAAAVARSRWEPTDDGDIVELRRWVAGRHAHLPEDADEPAPFGPATHDDEGVAVAATTPDRAVVAVTAGASTPVPQSAPMDDVASSFDRVPVMATAGTTLLEPRSPELSELIPRVRELLGDRLARLEFVSIEGEVLARWSSTDLPELAGDHGEVPTSS